jgi:hypothetical protein
MVRLMARWILAVAFCTTLTASDSEQLRQAEEKHRIFELRALLDQPGTKRADTLLYRAITGSRFGHEREAIAEFRALLATKAAPRWSESAL